MVITATARRLNPGALLVLPLVHFAIGRMRSTKLRAQLPPAQFGDLVT
jgi:hypothetical protein